MNFDNSNVKFLKKENTFFRTFFTLNPTNKKSFLISSRDSSYCIFKVNYIFTTNISMMPKIIFMKFIDYDLLLGFFQHRSLAVQYQAFMGSNSGFIVYTKDWQKKILVYTHSILNG